MSDEVHHYHHHDPSDPTMTVEISRTTRGVTYDLKVQGCTTKKDLDDKVGEALNVIKTRIKDLPDPDDD